MKLAWRTTLFSLGVGAIGAVALGQLYGLAGWVGILSGIGLALLSIYSFAMLGLLAASMADRPRPIHGFTVWILMAKLPIFALAIHMVGRLGEAATGCFLAGLALVYSALVLVGLMDRPTEAQP